MKLKAWIKRNVPKPALILYAVAVFSLCIHILCILFTGFADFFSVHIAGFFRMLLAKLSGVYRFSIAEILILSLPLIFVGIIVTVIRYSRSEDVTKINRFFAGAFAIVSLFYSTFVFTYGMGYRGYTLDHKLGLDKQSVSTDDLKNTALYLAEKVNETAKEVSFVYGGSSVMPYDFETLGEKVNQTYADCADIYPFLNNFSSRVKPMLLAKGMSYIHMLGMYTYYTGEANINTEFPDYATPFTVAHEMAHQRGIAREDEANFMAYLICTASKDPFIRYSGYLNMYEYTQNALYSADKSAYMQVNATLCMQAKYDMESYRVFFLQYKDSKAADVADTLNDAFLKGNGQDEGTRSYGLVVDLAVAYIKQINASNWEK